MTDAANRRGFLSFLGLGAVAGPQTLKELVSTDANIARTSKIIANSHLAGSLNIDSSTNKYKNAISKPQSNGRFISDKVRKLREYTHLEYINKEGLSPFLLNRIENEVCVIMEKGNIPAHISCIKSFSEVTKFRLAKQYYTEKIIKRHIDDKINRYKDNNYQEKLRRFTNKKVYGLRKFLGINETESDEGCSDEESSW